MLKIHKCKIIFAPFVKLKQCIPYMVFVAIFFIYNICVYFYLERLDKTRDQLLMKNMMHIINVFLMQDLENALNVDISDRGFLLLKDYSESQSYELKANLANTPIIVANSTIYIRNAHSILMFPLQRVTQAIVKIIPDYVLYTISINQNKIIDYNSGVGVHKVIFKHNINEQINTEYQFWINKASSYYLTHQSTLNKHMLTNAIVSFIVCCSLMYLYRLISSNIMYKIAELESDLVKERSAKEAFLSHRKANQKLTTYFVKKATEEFVRKKLKEDHTQEVELEGIDPSNYLFPIRFTNPKTTDINTTKLVQDLNKYFAEHTRHTDIKYFFKNDFLVVDCNEHVFLQLIYSLLSNILYFMDEQSDRRKHLEVHFKKNKLIIIYESFKLNEQTMIKVSNNHSAGRIDPFILNCERIFESLKYHNLSYKVYDSDNKNIIEINYKKTSVKKTQNNKELAKIIDLAQFKYTKEEN